MVELTYLRDLFRFRVMMTFGINKNCGKEYNLCFSGMKRLAGCILEALEYQHYKKHTEVHMRYTTLNIISHFFLSDTFHFMYQITVKIKLYFRSY